MDELWRALSLARRREILALVAEAERSAGEIAAAFSCTRPAVSQHLMVLKAAGLLKERREGTRRLYRAQPGALGPVQAFLESLGAPSAPEPAAPPPLSAWLELAPEEAFALFADPARLARWKGPLYGRLLTLEAPHRLGFTVGFSPETDGRARVEVEIAPDSGGSLVTLRHEGPGVGAWEHYLPRLECLARGWDPGEDDFSGLLT